MKLSDFISMTVVILILCASAAAFVALICLSSNETPDPTSSLTFGPAISP
jgi:hypothetical protein